MTTPEDGSMPSSFDNDREYNERGIRKLVRRITDEPLIPIGMALTSLALFNAYRAMKRGDRKATNRMFRARVYAQGFTILAIVAGGSYHGVNREKAKQLEKVKSEKDAEERRQQWIHELEVRDKEDKALRERLVKRRERREGRTSSANQESDQTAQKTENGGGGMFSGWLGSGSKSTPPVEEKESTKNAEPTKEVEPVKKAEKEIEQTTEQKK